MNKVPLLPLSHAATFDATNKPSTERPCLKPPRPPTRRLNLENLGSEKLNVFLEISGYGRIFHGKLGSNNPWWAPFSNMAKKTYT